MATSYHFLILGQGEVILAHRHNEDNGSYTLKTVDPLLPLGPLTTNIKHPAEHRNKFIDYFMSQKTSNPPIYKLNAAEIKAYHNILK